MKVFAAALLLAMLTGPVYSEHWDNLFANKQKSLLDYFQNIQNDVSKNAAGNFLHQSVNQGPHISSGGGSARTQEVIQQGQGDVTVQNVIQGPSFHYGDKKPTKPLQTQAVHQQGKGLVVVQNVVQGPSIHVPKFDFLDIKKKYNWIPWNK
ncbi:uncharacterized protein LOC125045526 [Penaeus chinensis]|uniref:uncharacterized protein LOC125045526 n=1 Tax=Penaeus chinensis TaxID=139456 RepID=UPI001FB80E58|nr:uncharacterized protein LOC125045526 [Penaeus chinensis]